MGGPALPRPEGAPAAGGPRAARRPLHPEDQAAAAARLVDLALGRGAARPRSRSTPSASSCPSCRCCSRSSRSRRWPSPSRARRRAAAPIDGDHVAIVLDTSASMATRVGGATGHDDANGSGEARGAEPRRRSLRPGADAIVIEAGREARVVAPLDRDPRRLQAAIATVGGPRGRGRSRRARSRSRPIVCVRSADASASSSSPTARSRTTSPSSSRGVPTEVVGVGDDEDNAAIVRVDVRSGVDAVSHREQVQVFAMVQSFGAHPREAYVTLAHRRPTRAGRLAPPAARRRPTRVPVVLTFEPRPEDHGLGLRRAAGARGRRAGRRRRVRARAGVAADAGRRGVRRDRTRGRRGPSRPIRTSTCSGSSVGAARDGERRPRRPRHRGGRLPGRPCRGGDALVLAPGRGLLLRRPGGRRRSTIRPLTSWEAGDPRLRFLTLDGVHVARSPDARRARRRSEPRAVVVDDARSPTPRCRVAR